MNLRRRIAGVETSGSLSNRLRQRRFAPVAQLLEDAHRRGANPVRVLDLGGNQYYWEQRGLAGDERFHFTTVDIGPQPLQEHANIVPMRGDATSLPEFADASFDVVFSNSAIEHVGGPDQQAAMAREVRRLAPAYYVQTPNYWFPFEPHFLMPAWQWLPRRLRIALVQRRRIGHIGPLPHPVAAAAAVDEIRLLRRSELRQLFPDATLVTERVLGLAKSFALVRES